MRQFSSLVTELSARGHEVHVAFQPTKGELPESAKQPGVTHGFLQMTKALPAAREALSSAAAAARAMIRPR